MTAPLRTTTEIARRFTRSEESEATSRVTRRLENWGNIGLLTPEGERSTGRGRARGYDEFEQIKAAVMLLAFAYQSPKGVLELISDLFDDIRKGKTGKRTEGIRPGSDRTKRTLREMAELLEAAKRGEKDVFLILEPTDPEALPAARFGSSLKVLEEQDSSLVVNITRAIRKVI